MKQLLCAVSLICIGMSGISCYLRIRGDRFLPTVLLVLGGACTLLGVIQLMTKRRRALFLTLALLGAIPVGVIGWSIADLMHFQLEGMLGPTGSRRDTLIAFAGMGLGALCVLTMLLIQASRSTPPGKASK